MTKGYKKRLFINLGILVGGILILSIVIILLNSDTKNCEKKIVQYKHELALRNKTIEFLGESDFNFKKIDEAIVILDDIIPAKDTLISFPKELENIGRKHVVDVGFKFISEIEAEEGKPGHIQFGMNLAGEFLDLVSFLEELEDHKYAIALNSIDVKKLDSGRFSLLTGGLIYTK